MNKINIRNLVSFIYKESYRNNIFIRNELNQLDITFPDNDNLLQTDINGTYSGDMDIIYITSIKDGVISYKYDNTDEEKIQTMYVNALSYNELYHLITSLHFYYNSNSNGDIINNILNYELYAKYNKNDNTSTIIYRLYWWDNKYYDYEICTIPNTKNNWECNIEYIKDKYKILNACRIYDKDIIKNWKSNDDDYTNIYKFSIDKSTEKMYIHAPEQIECKNVFGNISKYDGPNEFYLLLY